MCVSGEWQAGLQLSVFVLLLCKVCCHSFARVTHILVNLENGHGFHHPRATTFGLHSKTNERPVHRSPPHPTIALSALNAPPPDSFATVILSSKTPSTTNPPRPAPGTTTPPIPAFCKKTYSNRNQQVSRNLQLGFHVGAIQH